MLLKISKMTPWCPNDSPVMNIPTSLNSPVMNTPRESRLPGDEYTRESRLHGSEYTGESITNSNNSSNIRKKSKSFLGVSNGTEKMFDEKTRV
jgi:hypothetical protein